MTTFHAIKRSIIAAAGMLAAISSTATAQNYEGNHQVRFGAYLLGGRASGDITVDDTQSGVINTMGHSTGVVGIGVSGGLEWLRRGAWSWGVEIDGAALAGGSSVEYTVPRRGTPTLTSSDVGFDYLATVRARGGWYLRNDILWYGTLGVAFLGAEVKTGTQKVSSTQTGLAIGTGLEYDFGGGMLFAEYLYTGFGDIEAAVPGTHYSYNADLHSFRLGVKFKVGHDWYHDDVAARTGRPMK